MVFSCCCNRILPPSPAVEMGAAPDGQLLLLCELGSAIYCHTSCGDNHRIFMRALAGKGNTSGKKADHPGPWPGCVPGNLVYFQVSRSFQSITPFDFGAARDNTLAARLADFPSWDLLL